MCIMRVTVRELRQMDFIRAKRVAALALFLCRKGRGMASANDLEMLILAGRGDREAQTILRDGFLNMADGNLLTDSEMLRSAEIFARLAAAQGVVDDKLSLIAVLALRSFDCAQQGRDELAALYQSEFAGLIDDVLANADPDAAARVLRSFSNSADDGDEGSAMALSAMVAKLSRERAALLAAIPISEMEAR